MPIPGTTACGAKTRTGQPCRNPAMPNGRCRKHGGKTPAGLASPHTKTGRWSKHLPSRLAERFAETEHDPDLLSVRHDIRLIDALIMDNMKRLDVKDGESAESAESWKSLRKSLDSLDDNLKAKKLDKVTTAIREMRDVIDGRILYYATETEILSKLEQRRKMVETEQKILTAGEQAITVEKAMLLVGAIAGIIKTRIHDPNTLSAIQQDIGLLLHAPEAS